MRGTFLIISAKDISKLRKHVIPTCRHDKLPLHCIANAMQTGAVMKNATLPPLRVDPALREAAESVLQQGETLSGFVLEAVRLNIERREVQREFIARGLAARDAAKQSGRYVSSDEMLKRLDKSLAKARAKTRRP
jgi:predicted transcriptional regulator